jgi:arginyl-tRNA synthetase
MAKATRLKCIAPNTGVFIEELAEEARGQLEKLSGRKAFLDFGEFADFSSPLPMKVARENHRSPEEVAEEWEGKISVRGLRVESTKGFLNFWLTRDELERNLKHILRFHRSGKTVTIDYSSPNIAKPFSVGHLRSTVIGESLRRTFRLLGWKVMGINFIGDWGTQFGKLLAAYEKWPADLGEEPIKKLLKLYVKFHKEAEENEALEERARELFRKLEAGDPEAKKRWKKFRELSLKEFRKMYERLGTSKLIDGSESLFVEQGRELVGKLLKKRIAKKDQGAVVVPLKGKPPLILQKSDGTTIYSSRDLASALWRYGEFAPDLMLYVVGNEQSLHFQQLFDVLKKLDVKAEMEHVNFGLIRLPEGKMSSRMGRVVFLEEVLDEAVRRVEKIMKGRGGSKEDAMKIGIGAVKFADLKTSRTRNVMFKWDILSFEGATGPYVQYTAVRARRIGEKFSTGNPGIDDQFEPLARKLVRFRVAVLETARLRRPDVLASYLLELCKVFNELYVKERIGGNAGREWLAAVTYSVLEKGLWLLGMEVPEKM